MSTAKKGPPTPLSHSQVITNEPRHPCDDPRRPMYKVGDKKGWIPPPLPTRVPTPTVGQQEPVCRSTGEQIYPPPQPKHPRGFQPPGLHLNREGGEERRLKLRPIWVHDGNDIPDIQTGVYEAAPAGFERVLAKPTPEPPCPAQLMVQFSAV